MVSNSRNKTHQTWGPLFNPPLYSDQSEIRSAPHLILADHDGRHLAVRFDSRVTKDAVDDDDAIAAEFRAYRDRHNCHLLLVQRPPRFGSLIKSLAWQM